MQRTVPCMLHSLQRGHFVLRTCKYWYLEYIIGTSPPTNEFSGRTVLPWTPYSRPTHAIRTHVHAFLGRLQAQGDPDDEGIVIDVSGQEDAEAMHAGQAFVEIEDAGP